MDSPQRKLRFSAALRLDMACAHRGAAESREISQRKHCGKVNRY